MDFFAIILFLGLYYIRPQEWVPGVNALKPVTCAIALALMSLLVKHRGLSWRDLFRTPHDWLMAIYFLWIVATAESSQQTLKDVYPYFVFYWVTVIILTNIGRIQTFLNWWTAFIVVVALMALASEHGFDPTGTYDLTHGWAKDRLLLNTSIFNNPNGLGHSVVPAVVMLYFIGFWKRPIFMKITMLPIIGIPLYVIFLTVSKGAFMCGFATVVNALSFKRPKTVQAFIFVAALTVGWTALTMLPRMEEINKAGDKAIEGRLAAFHFGQDMMNTHLTGIGFGKFSGEFRKRYHYPKASHSSYVNIGCELGKPGLLLFVGILYCCLRTLILTRTSDDQEERVRRILFVLLISYMVSSWMVEWPHRAIFYLMAATVAAFHRRMLEKEQPQEQEQIVREVELVPALGLGALQPATVVVSATTTVAMGRFTAPVTVASVPRDEATELSAEGRPGIRWNGIRLLDVVLIFLMFRATIWLWGYIMEKM